MRHSKNRNNTCNKNDIGLFYEKETYTPHANKKEQRSPNHLEIFIDFRFLSLIVEFSQTVPRSFPCVSIEHYVDDYKNGLITLLLLGFYCTPSLATYIYECLLVCMRYKLMFRKTLLYSNEPLCASFLKSEP